MVCTGNATCTCTGGTASAACSVNGAAILLSSGAAKFPNLAGWRSAKGVIGSSVFWRPAATLQGRWNGIGGGI